MRKRVLKNIQNSMVEIYICLIAYRHKYGWHGKQWDFLNNKKTMEHSNHWIVTGWYYFLCEVLYKASVVVLWCCL
jgi:hypothetical protein